MSGADIPAVHGTLVDRHGQRVQMVRGIVKLVCALREAAPWANGFVVDVIYNTSFAISVLNVLPRPLLRPTSPLPSTLLLLM